jgi:hypothetical protein
MDLYLFVTLSENAVNELSTVKLYLSPNERVDEVD